MALIKRTDSDICSHGNTHISCDRDSGRWPNKYKGLVELHYTYASRFYCNSAVIKVIFDTIPFMSDSSNYVYIQRREYGIECHLLLVEVWNSSVFMWLWLLAEMGKDDLFFLFPSNHIYPDFWQLSNRATSMKLGMQLPNNIPQRGFIIWCNTALSIIWDLVDQNLLALYVRETQECFNYIYLAAHKQRSSVVCLMPPNDKHISFSLNWRAIGFFTTEKVIIIQTSYLH